MGVTMTLGAHAMEEYCQCKPGLSLTLKTGVIEKG